MSDKRDGRELGPPLEAHRFDEAALAKYLKDCIPGFTGNFRVEQFLGGQSNPTFLIEDASGSYVMRKKPPGKLLPSAHAVDREYKVISALADTRVPVAKARVLCEDDSVIGQMFYVMDYVSGRVLTERGFPTCSPDERTAMFHGMADVFGSFHAVDYKTVGLEDFGRPSGYVARQVARWSKQYEASKVEDWEPMDKLIAWLPENNPDDGEASIVHGDYRAGNLIFQNDRPDIVAVLDWELATIGHPLADLGYFMVPYRVDHEVSAYGIKGMDLSGLGIPPEEAVLETYAKAAGRDHVPNIDYYVVFSMFRLAAIQAGVLRRGLDGNAADPRAIERGGPYKQMAASAWAIVESL